MGFTKWSGSSGMVTVWHQGIFVFNSRAIKEMDLANHKVLLWFDKETQKMAISLVDENDTKAKRVNIRSSSATFSARRFLRENGILPEEGSKHKYALNKQNDLWVFELVEEKSIKSKVKEVAEEPVNLVMGQVSDEVTAQVKSQVINECAEQVYTPVSEQEPVSGRVHQKEDEDDLDSVFDDAIDSVNQEEAGDSVFNDEEEAAPKPVNEVKSVTVPSTGIIASRIHKDRELTPKRVIRDDIF